MVSYLILLIAVIKRHLFPERSHINLLFWLTKMKSTRQVGSTLLWPKKWHKRNGDFFQQFVFELAAQQNITAIDTTAPASGQSEQTNCEQRSSPTSSALSCCLRRSMRSVPSKQSKWSLWHIEKPQLLKWSPEVMQLACARHIISCVKSNDSN